jgi:hypothetical protein
MCVSSSVATGHLVRLVRLERYDQFPRRGGKHSSNPDPQREASLAVCCERFPRLRGEHQKESQPVTLRSRLLSRRKQAMYQGRILGACVWKGQVPISGLLSSGSAYCFHSRLPRFP